MYINGFVDKNQFHVRTLEGDFKFTPEVCLYKEESDGQYESIHGKKLSRIPFDTISDANKFLESYKDIFPIYGQSDWDLQILNDQYGHLKELTSDQVTIYSLDIEVEVPDGEGFPDAMKAEWPVNAITITDKTRDKIYAFGTGEWSAEKAIELGELDEDTANKVQYKQCVDEIEILVFLLQLWNARCPHVLTGWFSESFDIPYLYNRITKLMPGRQHELSPWRKTYKSEYKVYDNVKEKVKLKGIAHLDYYKLYTTFTFKERDKYSLNHICEIELNEKKISYEEEQSLYRLAKNNWQKFLSYNIKDAVLVDRLDEKLKLIPLAMEVAYKAKINFDDVFSPVKTWDGLTMNDLLSRGITAGINRYNNFKEKYIGGYVKSPIPKMYKWVISFDLESLYPNICQQWNIGPDTVVSGGMRNLIIEQLFNEVFNGQVDTVYLMEKNVSLAANSIEFDISKESFISKQMSDLMVTRKEAKSLMKKHKNLAKETTGEAHKKHKALASEYNTKQHAMKVLLNSGYGALGSIAFRFYDIRCAEAITSCGQLVIKYIEKKINDWMNKKLDNKNDYCIAIDTDSVYFRIDGLMERYGTGDTAKDIDIADKICKGIEKNVIKPAFDELCRIINGQRPTMTMDREAIAPTGFWAAKKRYALDVWDNEGYRYTAEERKTPKIMGLEAIQSRTPEWCRNRMAEGIHLILTGTGKNRMLPFLQKAQEDFLKLEPSEIAYNVKAGDFNKYKQDTIPFHKKGAQPQMRAILFHNKLIKDLDLKDVQPIYSGNKTKYLFLEKPNPYRFDCIAFNEFLDKRFYLDEYVSYNIQYERTFKNPIIDICHDVGLNTEEVISIDQFFS